MKTVYVTVTLKINDQADEHDVIESCDYSFKHEDIISTEIVEVYNDKDQRIF